MSEIINNAICTLIQILAFVIFIKKVLEVKGSLFNVKNIITMTFFYIFIMIVYNADYSGINTIIFFFSIVFGLFYIYRFDIVKSFLVSGLFMLTLFIADVLTSMIFVTFANIEELRSKYFIYANISVAIMTTIIVSIPHIKKLFVNIIKTGSKKKNNETVVFIVLLVCALSIIMYMVTKNFFVSEKYILNITGTFIFFILTFIFLKEKFEKDKLINKYDQLFEYVKTFEEWIDTENMNIHESKNQLATLRDMIKGNKKAVEYIDNIIKDRINIEYANVQMLKYIPKGGLKGLLYYKITVAENNGVSFFIDVSKNSNDMLSKFNVEETKDLCRLLGIFLDNAIEAAKETDKKSISCEIYVSKKILNIVVSNSISQVIDFSKIKNKGYTTKGKGRGKGLYLAEKISNNNPKILTENRIINNYYVQKIIIKK